MAKIFITGMNFSGTRMISKVLGAHPDIDSGHQRLDVWKSTARIKCPDIAYHRFIKDAEKDGKTFVEVDCGLRNRLKDVDKLYRDAKFIVISRSFYTWVRSAWARNFYAGNTGKSAQHFDYGNIDRRIKLAKFWRHGYDSIFDSGVEFLHVKLEDISDAEKRKGVLEQICNYIGIEMGVYFEPMSGIVEMRPGHHRNKDKPATFYIPVNAVQEVSNNMRRLGYED